MFSADGNLGSRARPSSVGPSGRAFSRAAATIAARPVSAHPGPRTCAALSWSGSPSSVCVGLVRRHVEPSVSSTTSGATVFYSLSSRSIGGRLSQSGVSHLNARPGCSGFRGLDSSFSQDMRLASLGAVQVGRGAMTNRETLTMS
mmetsp:Transcript_23573/g.67526  ORF Transcript_23573/g.67526 Transcript_23573/m.67526 type:complete len:145 (+) Transcript_23573:64-498(+)